MCFDYCTTLCIFFFFIFSFMVYVYVVTCASLTVCVVEITAASVANVCTFAVMGDMDIDQMVTQ